MPDCIFAMLVVIVAGCFVALAIALWGNSDDRNPFALDEGDEPYHAIPKHDLGGES